MSNYSFLYWITQEIKSARDRPRSTFCPFTLPLPDFGQKRFFICPPLRLWTNHSFDNLYTCIRLDARALSCLLWRKLFAYAVTMNAKPWAWKRQNFASLKHWELKTTRIFSKSVFPLKSPLKASLVPRDSWLPRLPNEIGGKIPWRNEKWRPLLHPLVRWQHLRRFQKVRTHFIWSYNILSR